MYNYYVRLLFAGLCICFVYVCNNRFFVCDCCDRNMEDYVTWVDTSKIRKHVLEYNEEVRMEGGGYR